MALLISVAAVGAISLIVGGWCARVGHEGTAVATWVLGMGWMPLLLWLVSR